MRHAALAMGERACRKEESAASLFILFVYEGGAAGEIFLEDGVGGGGEFGCEDGVVVFVCEGSHILEVRRCLAGRLVMRWFG